MRFCFLCMLFFLTRLSAEVSGEVGASYKSETKSNLANSVQEVDLTEFIGLNYLDYIYDPNLVTYDIRTKLEHKNIESSTNATSSNKNAQDYQYDINMHFFQLAYFPFTLYSKKVLGELTNMASSISARNIQDTVAHGINGHVELESSWVDYLVDISTIKQESSFSEELRKTKKIDMTLGNRFGVNESRINFQHGDHDSTIDDSLSNFFINNSSQRDSLFFYLDGQIASMNLGYEINEVLNKKDDINFLQGEEGYKEERYSAAYSYKPSQDFSLATAGSFSKNEEQEIQHETTTVDSYWQPTDNLSLTNNMFRISAKEKDTIVETYNYNLGATYLYNEMLTLLGHSNSYFIDSITDQNFANNLDLGFTYIWPFADAYLYTLNASLGSGIDKHTALSMEDKTLYSQRLDNLLTFKFDTYKLQLDVALNLYNMDSSLGEKVERLMFSTDFMGYPADNLRYLLSLRYINNMDKSFYNSLKNLNAQVNPDELGNSIIYEQNTHRLYAQNDTERWESTFKIDYNLMIGSDGKIFLGSGVKQTYYLAPEQKESLSLFADATFNYRIFRTLFYKLRGNIRNDSLYGTNEYTLYNEISYTLRQMKIIFNNEYWETSGGNRGNEQHIRTMLRVSREF